MGNFKKSIGSSKKRFGGHDSDRPIEKYKATCNECHKMCEVPFRPNGKKPVYCRDCFKANEPTHTSSYVHPPESSREDAGSSDLKKQFSVLNTKLDRLIAVIEANTRASSKDQE